MKYSNLLIIVLILFVLPLSLFAQNTRIAGTVVVEGTELPLIGANIVVVDANLGASTDAQGFFLIGNVPAGTYEVEAYYIGFIKQTKTVEVKAGEVAKVAFVMKTSILESDESITVTTDRIIQSQKAALNAQLNASNIKSVVSSDLIGSFPDEDAQTAISRIPGVFVDGSEAIMRGLPADYTLVTVNNERIPAINAAEDRHSQIETFPIDMIQAIEVSKGQTADLDADAIAGNINFIMKDAPNKTLFNFKIYTGYSKNQTSNYPIDQISSFGQSKGALTIGDLFMDGEFGYSVTGTWEKRTKSEFTERWDWDFDDGQLEDGPYEDVEGNPVDIGSRYYREAPTETEEFIGGVNTALLWKPSLGNKYTAKVYYSFYDLKDNDLELRDYFEDEEIEKLNDVKLEPKYVLQVAVGGQNLFSDWNLDYSLIYNGGQGQELHDVQANFLTDYDAYRGGDKNYYFDNNNIESETFDEDEYIGSINLKKPFQFGGTSGYAKAGLKYKTKDRFQQKLDSQLENMDEDDLLNPDDAVIWRTTIDDPFLIEWDPPLDMWFISDNSTSQDENYEANESIMSAYIMAEFWFGKNFMVLPGVRYEGTDWESGPRLIETYNKNNPDENIRGTTTSGNYDNLFPSLHLQYRLPANFNLRLSGSQGISRPSFRLLAGYNDYDAEDLELVTGNPDLLPAEATNVDFIVEWYSPQMAGFMSAGLFYKDIKNVMQEVTFSPEDGMYNGYEVDEVEQVQNVGTGQVVGLELAYQRQFDFIGLPNWGLLANWTHQLDTFLETLEGEKTTLPTQADDVINLALSYENADIGFSGRLSYQYISTIFFDKNDSEYYEEWLDPRNLLDLTLRQHIVKGVRLFVNARNILGEDRIEQRKNTRSGEDKATYGMRDWYIYNHSHRQATVWAGFEFIL
jgi:outer membrane receptor for ferrienterochelin and colicin